MSEFCPKTGRPCPVDKNFDRLKAAHKGNADALAAIHFIREFVELKRFNAGCEGMVSEPEDARNPQSVKQHCGSQVAAEMQTIASVTGELCNLEPGLFSGITVSEIR